MNNRFLTNKHDFTNKNTVIKQMTLAASLFAMFFIKPVLANAATVVVDDFSAETVSTLDTPRQFFNDAISGGKSVTENKVQGGKLISSGELIPARGQLGWSSSVLLLNADGTARDLSKFDGVKLVVQLNKGDLSLSANSTEVTNFDYHASLIMVPKDGKFHEIKIPFDSMKRAWSAQVALNKQTINSLSIVAFSTQKADFEFSVDEVSFY